VLAIQQHRVLADPAEAGHAGKLALQQGRGVDHAAHACPGRQVEVEFGQSAEPGTDYGVVVGPPRVAGNASLSGRGRARRCAAVGHAQHEDALRPLEDAVRVLAGFHPIRQVVHLARVAGCQPVQEASDAGGPRGRTRAGQVKAEPFRLLFEGRGQRLRRHGQALSRQPPGSYN